MENKKNKFVWMKKCVLCPQNYGQNMDKHMHSYAHHRAVEQLKGSEQLHNCQACDASVVGLKLYNKHIATLEHKRNLRKLQQRRCDRKGLQVDYNSELNDLKALYDKKEKNFVLDTNSHPFSDKQKDLERCFVCCHRFPKQELDKHMHSFIHHQAIEQLKGSEQVHKCLACDMVVTELWEYKKHIATHGHKNMLSKLQKRTSSGENPVDYSVEFDDEFKARCAKRDKEKIRKKEERKRKWKVSKMAKFKNNMMRTSSEDFTTDHMPPSCNLISSWEKLEQNISSSRQLNCKLPKRRLEVIPDMEGSNCPLVKRPYVEVTFENLSQEMSACTTYPSLNGNVSNVCTAENGLCASAEPTCAPELVQGNECNISTMLGTNCKSLDIQGHKDKHVKQKGWPVKQSMTHLGPENNRGEACSNDVVSALKSHKQVQPYLKLQTVDICTLAEADENETVPSENKQASPAVLRCSSSQTEIIKPNLRTARGFSSLQWSKCLQTSKSNLEQGIFRKSIHVKEPYVAPVPSITSLAEMFESRTSETYNTNDCQILENYEEVQPHYTLCVKNDAELENHNTFGTVSSNLWQTKRTKRDISNNAHRSLKTKNATSKKKQLDELMTLSLREEELNSSFENVGEQLLQAYSTLQNAYTEVQHLLAVKQQVSSDMAVLRTKRIKILKDLKNTSDSDTSVGDCSTHSDQQEALNAS
ncbi:uncharacterized protein LOC127622088 [Xyrauchen texanus]|uniref:uncharacterized protein LOC127622088 n=1 Tax=Xyrauchen texanus TaxID=154827 RepID=UPI0022422FB6|nr:uncharacterized protein LOC127622088 [Xyrauchen texanus]